MTDEQPKKLAQSEPLNPLDFPIKDPLRETHEGRWQQLPVIQKVGVITTTRGKNPQFVSRHAGRSTFGLAVDFHR
jgi:hypothetical protein